MSLKAPAMRDASSRPRSGMRRVRSVSVIVCAVSASERSGFSTRPARRRPRSDAITIVTPCVAACVHTASSISDRSNCGKLATTKSPSWPPSTSGRATYRALPALVSMRALPALPAASASRRWRHRGDRPTRRPGRARPGRARSRRRPAGSRLRRAPRGRSTRRTSAARSGPKGRPVRGSSPPASSSNSATSWRQVEADLLVETVEQDGAQYQDRHRGRPGQQHDDRGDDPDAHAAEPGRPPRGRRAWQRKVVGVGATSLEDAPSCAKRHAEAKPGVTIPALR